VRAPVVIAFALGCGGSPPPAAPPPPSNTTPSPPASAIGDTVVDHLRAYRDDMCACADGGCVREVNRELRRWHDHHKDLEGRPRSSEADQLDQAIHSCETTAKGSASPGDLLAAMTRFTGEMCSCADQASAECAKKVTDEVTEWAKDVASKAEASAPPTDEEARVMRQFTDCATKAMMAGVQQPANP
jgi:hypothetical protein